MDILSYLLGFESGKSAGGGSGGGSSADVRYVTFMSYDGAVEYGKKAVAVGDNCADPIARGVFSTPTRESTAQYNYDFAGWATTPNGAMDANWGKAVTEDRTVYANFAAIVRYYTITYLDTDGSVLKTESLAYGAMPSYTPQKDGVIFDTWQPVLETVTGDMSYTAKWQEKITFADSTWADIVRIANAGEAKNYFAVGDTRIFAFTDPDGVSRTTTLKIVGFNKDTLSDGSGTAAMTVVAMSAEFLISMGTDMLYGGWENSVARTSLHNNLIPNFPAELQTGLKTVVKKTRKYVDGTDQTGLETTNDKIWLLSLGESGYPYVTANWGVAGETVAENGYSYSGVPDPMAAATYGSEVPSGAQSFWTRSSGYKYSRVVARRNMQNSTVTCYYNNANAKTGCIFGFCI